MEKVILVDTNDKPIGTMEKMEAHEKGLLHRAFSIFVFNQKKELLIHQRAFEKYHSGGLWTNTCCSHPRENETTEAAAHRRLVEEMGFDCSLEKRFDFIYKATLDKGLTEHEFDHVFIGEYEAEIIPNPNEVAAWKYIALDKLYKDVAENPEHYTAWFKIALEQFKTTAV